MVYTIIFCIIGLSAGLFVSAGVFALVTSSGLMARFAQKTHTAKYVQTYETMVILGGSLFNIFWVFKVSIKNIGMFSDIMLPILGICQGVFVGCLAVSLAEALNATAIFGRRAKLRSGLSFIILFAALGKSISSIIQFFH